TAFTSVVPFTTAMTAGSLSRTPLPFTWILTLVVPRSTPIMDIKVPGTGRPSCRPSAAFTMGHARASRRRRPAGDAGRRRRPGRDGRRRRGGHADPAPGRGHAQGRGHGAEPGRPLAGRGQLPAPSRRVGGPRARGRRRRRRRRRGGDGGRRRGARRRVHGPAAGRGL